MTKATWNVATDPELDEYYSVYCDASGSGYEVCGRIGVKENAALIAAAPDLLAALQVLLSAVYDASNTAGADDPAWNAGGSVFEATGLADAAIARATGEGEGTTGMGAGEAGSCGHYTHGTAGGCDGCGQGKGLTATLQCPDCGRDFRGDEGDADIRPGASCPSDDCPSHD